MKKTITLLTLIVILLSGCGESVPSSASVTSTQTFTAQTNTESPTSTITPDPLAGAPEGTTGINSSGQWIKTVTENGHEYKYVYNAELGWVREAGTIILFDGPLRNYLPYTILVAENVENERSFISIFHQDVTDINAPFNPLTRTLKPELEARYFQDDPRKQMLTNTELQTALQLEMQGMGTREHQQAYLEIIVANGTPEGQVKKVKLSETTGIILNLMNDGDITRLGGENVLELNAQNNGQNYTYFVEVYGVDEAGNELARIAFKDPLNQIPEKILRKVLFSIPGNLIDHKDQREQGFTNIAQIFAQYSEKLNDDGTQDFEIKLTPLVQP